MDFNEVKSKIVYFGCKKGEAEYFLNQDMWRHNEFELH